MARINNEAQWIILMSFLVCIALFFLAVVVNESTLVGRTTAESVLDFSKSDIQDIRSQVLEWMDLDVQPAEFEILKRDVNVIAMDRMTANIEITNPAIKQYTLHYNDGVTQYDVLIQRY